MRWVTRSHQDHSLVCVILQHFFQRLEHHDVLIQIYTTIFAQCEISDGIYAKDVTLVSIPIWKEPRKIIFQ